MFPTRMVLLSALMLSCVATALAQRPGPQFWRKVGCEPLEPRTKLEALEDRQSTVLIKGFSRITTVDIAGVRVDAVEMREMGNVSRAKGVVITLRDSSERQNERPNDIRAFIDYEELDPLLNAIDAISKADETVTKLAGFEARYRTLGDFEVAVFRQTRSGTAVILQTGICERDRARNTLSLDELAKLRAMIQEAKTRLDELR
jgi:hypothetical protein